MTMTTRFFSASEHHDESFEILGFMPVGLSSNITSHHTRRQGDVPSCLFSAWICGGLHGRSAMCKSITPSMRFIVPHLCVG
jgi:hypothetical protein